MGVIEAITQLEIIATNMVGRLAETHDEREAKIISKQIEFPHWNYCPSCGAKMERSKE